MLTLHAAHGLSRTLKINGKDYMDRKRLFLRHVASCVQTRLVLSMHGFPVITMHLGDQNHCVAGFTEAVSSYRACMNETHKARAGIQS